MLNRVTIGTNYFALLDLLGDPCSSPSLINRGGDRNVLLIWIEMMKLESDRIGKSASLTGGLLQTKPTRGIEPRPLHYE